MSSRQTETTIAMSRSPVTMIEHLGAFGSCFTASQESRDIPPRRATAKLPSHSRVVQCCPLGVDPGLVLTADKLAALKVAFTWYEVQGSSIVVPEVSQSISDVVTVIVEEAHDEEDTEMED
ncbi:hypothetical protein B0H14DRAFT_2621883 [Mycena olivaceomarginata]|nr:hypothetical protein B0H14DRAFT_2621883 [Mycena olivaceomarginata]